MGIEWHIEHGEESKVQILQFFFFFFATDDRSEEELQRSVELSGECSHKTHTRAGGERNKIYRSVKASGNKGLKWKRRNGEAFTSSMCVLEAVPSFSLLCTFLVLFSYLRSASLLLHAPCSSNIMCVTLTSLRLFKSVIPGTQDHYRFFHILYILSITDHFSA